MGLALKKEIPSGHAMRYTIKDYLTWEDGEDWEIIDGIAYNMAPSATPRHQIIEANILTEISNYLKGQPCKVMSDIDVILLEDVFKPDIVVVCDKNKIKDKNIVGAPDLIVEIISPSTAKKDRTLKLKKYMENGVKEYWIVDPKENNITVYKKGEPVSDYFDMEDESIPVAIFENELKIEMKFIFDVE